MPTLHRPRFERVPTRSFHLTDRDLKIIEYVEQYRLLASEQIVGLLGEGSPQHVRRRLQLLFHNRYLDRPAAQSPLMPGLGKARGSRAPGYVQKRVALLLDWGVSFLA